MTQIIQTTKIETRNVFSSGSRYNKQNIIYYGDKKIITVDTYNRESYQKTGSEKIMLLTKGVEYRPDLVSYDVYGYVDNWWRILEANQMKDIWDFKAGKTIILPDRAL